MSNNLDARPIKSGLHNIVELDITDTLDFHIASTNLVKIVNDYVLYNCSHPRCHGPPDHAIKRQAAKDAMEWLERNLKIE